jgi:hypothetical protein
MQELQRILSRSIEFLYSGMDTGSGLQLNCDYLLIIKTFEMDLLAWKTKWLDNQTWERESSLSTPVLYHYLLKLI